MNSNRKRRQRWILPLLAVLLTATLMTLSCDARGSGSHSGKSPAAGYKSGSYTAPKSGGTYNNYSGGYSGSTNSGGWFSGAPRIFFFGNFGSGGRTTGSGGGFLALLVIVVVILIIVFWLRRSRGKGKSPGRVKSYPSGAENFDMKKELEEYKEIYAALIFGIDDVQDFIGRAELDKRRCARLLPVLKQYIDMLEDAVGDGKRKVSAPEDLRRFRGAHHEELEKLKDCAGCKCVKCAKECRMSGCMRCEPGYRCRIASCDNKTAAVYTFDDRTIELTNNDTGMNENLKVLAVVEDTEYRQLYIILEKYQEKIILYYYPGVDGDSYGEITDTEDLDFAVKAYESIQL